MLTCNQARDPGSDAHEDDGEKIGGPERSVIEYGKKHRDGDDEDGKINCLDCELANVGVGDAERGGWCRW
jgi:hypothetical protein